MTAFMATFMTALVPASAKKLSIPVCVAMSLPARRRLAGFGRTLIGWRDYSPAARGMQAALPYVDLFAPAHDLASLPALEPYLARIR
jgi:hypothetical protein